MVISYGQAGLVELILTMDMLSTSIIRAMFLQLDIFFRAQLTLIRALVLFRCPQLVVQMPLY